MSIFRVYWLEMSHYLIGKEGKMSIQARCSKCKSDYNYKAKKCPVCGASNKGQKKAYRIVLRQNGKKITRIVSTLTLAKELETKFKGDIIRGEHVIARKKPVIVLSEFWEKHYLPWAKENKRSWQADKSFYEHCIKPVLGRKTLEAISPFDIERLYSSMKKATTRLGNPYSEKSMKHAVILLSRLYVLAGNWGKYKGDNPCSKVRKPKPNNEITEFLSDKEMQNLNKVLSEYPDRVIACLIKFAMVTGIRRGELLKLKWQDIDLNHKQMVLIDPKGKINQSLPLSDEAIAILNETPKFKPKEPSNLEPAEYVFFGKKGKQLVEFRKHWNKIKETAKLPKDFRFHGLRHNFASHLVSSGTDLYTVSKLLTHKSMAVTQRYAHLADEHLREAVNKAGRLLTEEKINKQLRSQEAG